jgi:hypothetical protein
MSAKQMLEIKADTPKGYLFSKRLNKTFLNNSSSKIGAKITARMRS